LIVTVAVVGTLLLGIMSAWNPDSKRSPPRKALVSYTTHAPIHIMGDADFTLANGVTPGGTGTSENPYVIENWEIDGAATGCGVYLYMTTKYCEIRNIHAFGAGSDGVALTASSNVTVEGCLFDDGQGGIVGFFADNTNITNNVVTNQQDWGIALMLGHWANITGNDLSKDNFSSIIVGEYSNVTVSENKCLNDNVTGLFLSNVTDAMTSGNNFSENGCGIAINDTHRAVIMNNDITLNGFGVLVANSSSITVYHNRIIGNTKQAMDDNNTLIAWDDGYPSGGNYWSDYAGSDLMNGPNQDLPGGDGIGDTPYAVNATSMDKYPFMDQSGTLIPEFGTMPLVVMVLLVAIVLTRERGRRKAS
jgi:parallel beta-helix repeat protein